MLSVSWCPSRWTLALLIGMTAMGCQRWRVDSQATAQPVPERRRFEIWMGRQSQVVHGVQVRGDSIRAVPYWRPPACDSCAVYFQRAAIDSIRVQKVDNLRTGLAVGLATAMMVVGYWFAAAMSSMQ